MSARVLSQEVSICMQLAAAARLRADRTPTGIGPDFNLPTLAFQSLGSGLGTLPTETVGHVVQFYHYVGMMNAIPSRFGELVDRWRALETFGDTPERQRLKQELDDTLAAYRAGLELLVTKTNQLLPHLRRLSHGWWRLDYFLSKKVSLTPEQMGQMLDASDERMRKALADVQRHTSATD